MKSTLSQSQRGIRSCFGQVPHRAAATNVKFSDQIITPNLCKSRSVSSLKPQSEFEEWRVPSEGNVERPRSARRGRSSDRLQATADLASLEFLHDSGVWVGDSAVKKDSSVEVRPCVI